MTMIKVNRINKGGEIAINSDRILFIEIESRTTTVRMTDNLIFSVEESVDAVMAKIESVATARISNAIRDSGLVTSGKPSA